MKYWPLLICWVLGCQPAEEEMPPSLPNIVWIVAEDLSPIIPPFGDSTAATPQLNRLAAEGIRYPNTFSVAGVCAPSRAALATGMYPISIGAQHMRNQSYQAYFDDLGIPAYEAVPPPAARMISQRLRQIGYFCTNNDKQDYQFAAPLTAWDEQGPNAHYRHRPDADQPFFSIFNLGITHESQVWTTGLKNLRWTEGFEDPAREHPRWKDRLEGDDRPLLTVGPAEVQIPPYLVDDEVTRQDVARVYSNIEIMDRQLGLLLDQLAADGLLDNTIVVWYTDHGGPLPRQKRLLYDSGLRVPLIIRWPDQYGAGTLDSSLVSFVDFAPSTYRMVGLDQPDYLQGVASLGRGSDLPKREYAYGAADRLDEIYDRIRAVTDGRFKYLRNYYPERGYYLPVSYREQMGAMQSLLAGRDAGTLNEYQAQWFRAEKPQEELFDTAVDPHELHNLADDPSYATQLAELRAVCDAWLAEVGDLSDWPEPELVAHLWQGNEQPQVARPYLRRDSLGRFVLISETPGAEIAYRIWPQDSARSAWRIYQQPLEWTRGDSLTAIAHRIGYLPSEIAAGR